MVSSNSEKLAKVPSPKSVGQLRNLLIAGLALLFVEYLLGILVNLYSSPPYNDELLSFHYAMGVIIIIFPGVVLLAVSARHRSLTLFAASLVALASIAVAGQAGRTFAFQGQDSVFSFMMAVAFLISFSSYFLALFSIKKVSQSP